MADSWSGGYVHDIAYTDQYFGDFTPVWLNHIAVSHGVIPRRLDRPFAYMELGSGMGHTLTVLAGAYPEGRFYGVDFSPTHVAHARAEAERLGVGNVTFLEKSFGEVLQEDLPQMDFMVSHGVHSWIPPEARQDMVRLFYRFLAPGGLAYVSYNALPGWAGMSPLRRLVAEIAERESGTSADRTVAAFRLAQSFLESGTTFARAAGNTLPERLKSFISRPPAYLAHEFLNRDWNPMYCIDVWRELAAAKLTFVGSATPLENHPELMMSRDAYEFVRKQPSREHQQLFQDFAVNTQFRRDIFVKGCATPGSFAATAALRNQAFGLTKSRDELSLKIRVPQGELNLDNDLAKEILNSLCAGPAQLGEIADRLPKSQAEFYRLVKLMAAARLIVPFAAKPAMGPVIAGKGSSRPILLKTKFNCGVVAQAFERTSRTTLAAPLLGGGLPMDVVDLGFLGAVCENGGASNGANGRNGSGGLGGDPVELVADALERRGLGLRGEKDATFRTKIELEQHLRPRHLQFTEKLLPTLASVGVIEFRE